MSGFADEDEGVTFDDSWIEDVPDSFEDETLPPDEKPQQAVSGLTPEWLGEMEDGAENEVELTEEEGQMFDFGFVSSEPETAQPAYTGPVDWSQEMEDPARSMMGGEDPIEQGTEESGDLPDWLKAMRPDDENVPGLMEAAEYEGGEVERGGPLAGLRGLLRAEPSVGQGINQALVSDKLTVSDSQQASAEILRRMVEAETEPDEVRSAPIVTQQGLLRALFAVLLILAVLFPMLFPIDLNRPIGTSDDAENVFLKSFALSDDGRVLVAFDYEPGRSAELDASAAGVLDLLMLSGARLAVVSTSPIGPAVGENLMTDIYTERSQDFVYGGQYVNLGYISGGATGLQSFATFPKETVSLGYDDVGIWNILRFSKPWDAPMMEGVNVVRDFEMVIVITDNADTARNWIEQVEPEVRDGGLVMIASAQIEPMVRPFYETQPRKLDGLITSIDDGAVFEGRSGQPSLSTSYWNSLGSGMLVAVILISAVGGYNFAVGILRDEERSKRRRR
jgi:hypothetical protein